MKFLILLKFTENDQKERAKIVMTELEKIYPEVPIPLNHRNAYELLFAVALSAQTTDKSKRSNSQIVFCSSQSRKMAALEEPEIKELIKEIGLSTFQSQNLKSWPINFWKDIMRSSF